MKHRKLAVLLIISLLFVSCAGIRNMTPEDRSLMFCSDFMKEHKNLDDKSKSILADKAVDDQTKVFVATQINPKLNALFPLIRDYCSSAFEGGTPSSQDIEAAIANLTALFTKERK